MIEKDPLGNALRQTQREAEVPEGTVCVLCGESDPRTIEWHHPAGRSHAAKPTVPVCKNCHAKASEGQRTVGADLRSAPSLVERIANALRSLGEFFVRMGNQLLEWAEGLLRHAGLLDLVVPNWRTL